MKANGSKVDRGLDLASELLEDQVLVLHLGHEPGGLEEALAVAPVRRAGGLPVREGSGALGGGVALEDALDVVDHAVVLGVEHLVDGGQADVLVDPAVTGDEVGVQHLVVVGAGELVREVGGRGVVLVRLRGDRRGARVVVGVLRRRVGVVRDVGEERRLEGDDVVRHRHRRRGVALDEDVVRRVLAVRALGDVLRQPALGTGEESPVRVHREHRDAEGVLVLQQAQQLGCLGLRVRPGWPCRRPGWQERPRAACPRAACRSRPGGRPRRSRRAREDLVGRVRRVGLALVDPGRVRVQRVLDVVGGAEDTVRTGLVLATREHHEAAGWPGGRPRCRPCGRDRRSAGRRPSAGRRRCRRP